MKSFTKRAGLALSPSMSCITSTWPSHSGAAPIPVTGMFTAAVISALRARGTHSSSSMAAPAFSRATAASSSSRAPCSSLPWTR